MKYKQINDAEREQIYKGLLLHKSFEQISIELGRSGSTIGREIFRNGGTQGYSPIKSKLRSEHQNRKSHKRQPKIIVGNELYLEIVKYLRKKWSPRQISHRMKSEYPDTPTMQVSGETIYEFIYVQTRGGLKKELIRYLRQKKKNRKPAKGRSEKRGKIMDMVQIDKRPSEVNNRVVPGHWEGDLIMGKGHQSQIGTLVERKTRYVLLVPLKSKEASEVRKSYGKTFRQFPDSLKKTLTYDQGKEMAEHKQFTIETKMKVYFCHPASPWERGSNENTNMLVRDFFPKGTDFSKVKKSELQRVQDLLNDRIRETLGWACPKDVMNQLIQRHAD